MSRKKEVVMSLYLQLFFMSRLNDRKRGKERYTLQDEGKGLCKSFFWF
ncbi:MAG: hypothetical protein LBI72_00360 [Flavobacteriaceae bacterium]|nr:hypothetical protein [Flavobacteriaceae bacterium]